MENQILLHDNTPYRILFLDFACLICLMLGKSEPKILSQLVGLDGDLPKIKSKTFLRHSEGPVVQNYQLSDLDCFFLVVSQSVVVVLKPPVGLQGWENGN